MWDLSIIILVRGYMIKELAYDTIKAGHHLSELITHKLGSLEIIV
jgi:hypothetical protein